MAWNSGGAAFPTTTFYKCGDTEPPFPSYATLPSRSPDRGPQQQGYRSGTDLWRDEQWRVMAMRIHDEDGCSTAQGEGTEPWVVRCIDSWWREWSARSGGPSRASGSGVDAQQAGEKLILRSTVRSSHSGRCAVGMDPMAYQRASPPRLRPFIFFFFVSKRPNLSFPFPFPFPFPCCYLTQPPPKS